MAQNLDDLIERARTIVACDNEEAAHMVVDELTSQQVSNLHRLLVAAGWPTEGPTDATAHDSHAPFQWKDALNTYVLHQMHEQGVVHTGRQESGPDAEQGTLF